MGQEFFINSQTLEDQVRKLLPSQGGAGAGFDLSASTQIIPIIDLTESAEGSGLRQDLQTAVSNSVVNVTSSASTVDLVINTGFWRIFGGTIRDTASGSATVSLDLNDGVSNYSIFDYFGQSGQPQTFFIPQEYVVFVKAGSKVTMTSGTGQIFKMSAYQISSIDGTLTNPLGF